MTRNVGPNGSQYDNSGKFTQKQRYNEYKAWKDADAAAQVGALKIAYDAKQYDDWEKMHDGAIWFDTAACAVGDHIGNANKVTI